MLRRLLLLAKARRLCAFLVPYVLLLGASAQAPSSLRDTQSTAKISQARAAFSQSQVVSVQLEGTVVAHFGVDERGTISLQADGSGGYRMDLRLPSGNRAESRSVSTDALSCSAQGKDGVTHEAAVHNCLIALPWFLPDAGLGAVNDDPLVAYESRSEIVDGVAADLVHIHMVKSGISKHGALMLDKLSSSDLLLDPASALPVRLRYNSHPDSDANLDLPTEIRYSDYHLVNGVQIPFRIEKYLNHSLILEITVQSAVAQ
jgi:hypothetical protein